jgi:hypothetical protein
MHQTLSMSSGETGGDLTADSQDLPDRKRSVVFEPSLQGITAYVRHHQVRQFGFVRNTVNGNYVWVKHGRRSLGLPSKSLPCRAATRQMRSQHLYRNNPV